MNILITGGAGFIGSHLTELLLEQGHTVQVIDNFSTGKRANLPASPRLKVIEADVRDRAALMQVTKEMDAIVHLAAVASVQASVEDPVTTHDVNLGGTINLLEAARINNVKRFVFASSASVYGDVQQLPVSQDTPLAPLTPYAADKLASEHYIDFYRRQHGLTTAIFRFFNIYGPRQDPSSPYSGVISIFIEKAINNQPITIFGDGLQSRDFVYVSDLTNVLSQALVTDTPHCGAINVGNGCQTTLLELIETVQSLTKQTLHISHAPARPGDIRHSVADAKPLQKAYNYSPAWPLAKGLEQTCSWYQAQHRND
ncbi:MAG: NAD-dependent epimerase/dehydratase family protein [Desulfuromonas sp.]|nr:NAD-dependent epimerase/dehydratase family protein [Desulfuromonas sp.]